MNDKIAKSMEYITMADINKDINLGRILLSEYDGIERDLCLYLVQGYYKEITINMDDLNRHGKEKALAYAKWYATRRLSSEKEGLGGLVERAKLFLLNDAENTGWHHSLEYEDIAELLASILEEKEGMTEAYDWKFIVEQLLPAAEHAGIDSRVVMGASINIKKIRGIVSPARELLHKQQAKQITKEEAEETLKSWMKAAADPNVSYDGLREDLDTWRGKSVKRKDPLIGYKIMMPDGKFMICIPTESDRDIPMIEQALKNRISLRLTGFDWLQQKVIGQSKEYRLMMEKLDRDHKRELIQEGLQASRENGVNNTDPADYS